MTDFISLNRVSKKYGSGGGIFHALKDITVGIASGEHVAIVGKSGSGKSTLLNMLTGIDHPSDGTVSVNGTDIHRLDESELATWRGKNIGIVFQFFQLIPTLSILENILLAMDFVNAIPKKGRMDRADSLLKLVGIDGHGNKLPSGLSGGEQQRAAIARALANDPPVLVADEPTGNLDSSTSDVIRQLFVDLSGAGKTVIVVTHEKPSDREYDRIMTLSDGSVVADYRNNESGGVKP